MSQFERSTSGATVVAPVQSGLIGDVLELTKPRLTRLVVITTGVGFAIAAMGRSWGWIELIMSAFLCLLGAWLSAGGANALNMWWERTSDARMRRTAGRPIPDGRMSPELALAAGLAMSSLGVGILAVLVNPAAAAVSLATILLYILVYTPMKQLTPLSTIAGALPGALPPLIGWAGAAPDNASAWQSLAQAGGWSLFMIIFVWQIPHFLAIAWMHRDDYERGGHRVLPVVDPTGHRTSSVTLIWTLTLIPVSIAPVIAMPAPITVSWVYGLVAGLGGLVMLSAAVKFIRLRSDASARSLFLTSIMYLPLLLLAMVVDAGVSAAL